MDPEFASQVVPMVVLVVLMLSVSGVILLKPLSTRLGMLLEAMARDRNEPKVLDELSHVRDLLESLDGRVSLLEERQDFTDALLSDPERKLLRAARSAEEKEAGDAGAESLRAGEA